MIECAKRRGEDEGLSDEGRAVTIERVLETLPDWGNAIAQLNSLIAERMGVVLSDLDALHALNRGGPATAGELAIQVGLTSGSASRMVDRLEEAGCVRRVRDRGDRRRVLVEPTDEGLARVRAYYDRLTSRTRTDLADFTDAELATVCRFLGRSTGSVIGELARLRSAEPAQRVK